MESLKNAPLITVFTATYNRGHLIQRIYQSLLRQKEFNFEWLVIDDGSQDQTEDLFNDWTSRDNPFEIRYYKQENRGLIRTLNRGIELARGEYFAKIDSDDYVVDDYMRNVSTWIASIAGMKDIYAVAGVKVDSARRPLKGKWPIIPPDPGYLDATDLQRAVYDLDADMCEAWRTDVLRQYPFPVWKSEKFAPEQIVFNQIALDGYKIRWYPTAMAICEYQDDGLTKGSRKLEIQNPMGYAMMYNHKLKYDIPFAQKLRCAMQCTALSIVGRNPQYILQTNLPIAAIETLFPGVLLAIRRKWQYRCECLRR